MVSDLKNESEKAELKMNKEKTKYMSNVENSHSEDEFVVGGNELIVGGKELEVVHEYTYLGSIMSFEDKTEKEVNGRRKKAWKNFWALKQVYKSDLETRSEIRIFETCTMPTLIYGVQTWALTKSQAKKLQTTQRIMERSIMGIKKSERIPSTHIRKLTKTDDVTYVVRKMKARYAGHVARQDNSRWSKKVTEWTPYDEKRGRGRPITRWRDELDRELGVLWPRATQNRKAWRKIEEAYAQKWVFGGQ